ncbi:MAG: Hpt domain-containing protein [Deltaproteobacteria bacterium]|nr:Hpt domain-containing protein [Deltaproteobacteria bacterium]
MRLELGHRDFVTEHGIALIEDIERGALSLSGSGDHTAALNGILGDVQTFRIAIGAVHDFAPLVPTVDEFEGLVKLIRDGSLPMDNKIGGVLLHVVSTFRNAVANLGTATRAGRMLPKVLQDLNRVMSALKQNKAASLFAVKAANPEDNPVSVAVRVPVAATVSETRRETATETESPSIANLTAIANEYSEVFLRDEAGLFSQVLELGRRLATDPYDRATLTELFRMIHTVKGNSMALGFEGMTAYAHAVEDLLYQIQSGHLRASARVARMVLGCADTLKVVLDDYRRGSDDHAGIEERVAEVRRFIEEQMSRPQSERVEATAQQTAVENLFFLSVRIGGRELLVPCSAVSQVLRGPRVMAIPGGRKGWLGVIRAGNVLVPLVDPQALVGVNVGSEMGRNPPWSIILGGSSIELAERSLFAVPVDEIGTVTELPFGIPAMSADAFANTTVLDITGMMKRIW